MTSLPASAQPYLIPRGAVWHYEDHGNAPDPAWQTAALDDTNWAAGAAPLGYGRGDETTVVDQAGDHPVVIRFRRLFEVPDRQSISNLTLRLNCDDGAVVYLNGAELYRNNLPEGNLDHLTPALSNIVGVAETNFIQRGAGRGALLSGTNLLAVALHQAGDGRQDARFDLELEANLPLTRPSIAITSPTNGQVRPVGPLTIRTEVSDLDGHIYRVDFYDGTNRLGETTAPPYQWAWSAPSPGPHSLKALAIDNSGRRDISDPVHVLIGEAVSLALARGPYLQMASPTGIVVRWRTSWFADSRVQIGPAPFQWQATRATSTPVIDHEVHLTGLLPHTTYYYAVGNSNQILAAGSAFSLTTAAPPGESTPTRVWAIGDSGTANANARAVREAYTDFNGFPSADVWLMLGDNAYESGTDDEYQAAVFDLYQDFLRQTVLWPTIGNHDVTFEAPEAFPYLSIFTLPRQAEAGGLASGTERFYAFDHANIHFVCLDSHTSDRQPGGAMLTWLENDLAATAQDWIIAYWHHPPYSKGTHDSDTERTMIEMRENVVPLLERYGVDLVLCGHSHVYERSYLLNGHYGSSTNLSAVMVLDDGPGRPASAAYRKPAGGLGAQQGAVYVVCGCSGEGGGFRLPDHPAMVFSYVGFGSVILDIDGLTLHARFLNEGAYIKDEFFVVKGAPEEGVRPALSMDPSDTAGAWEISWPTSLRPFAPEERTRLDQGPWHSTTDPVRQEGRRHLMRVVPGPEPRWYRLRADP